MTAISLKARQILTPLRIQMAIGFGAKGLTAVASFALNWLIARRFGASGVGLFGVAQTTALMGSTLALMGLEYVTVRQVAKLLKLGLSGEARRTLFAALRQTALTSLALAGGLFLFSDPFARVVLEQGDVARFLAVMAFAIPIVALAKIASAALRGSGQVLASQSIDGPIGTGLTAAVLGILVWTGGARDPLLPAILYVAFGLLATSVAWLLLLREVRRWNPSSGPAPTLIRMGVPILAIAMSQMFVDWFALLVLTAQGDPAQAGLFRIAYQVVSVLNLLNVASEGILAPVIAQEHATGNRARIAVVMARTSALLVTLASPLLLVCFFAPQWILGLFGPEFIGAALALRILAVGQLVNLALGPIGGVLVMTHNERWSLAYGIAAALMCAGLCLWLIPLYGTTGAAIAVTSALLFRRLAGAAIVRFVVGIELWRWRAPPDTQE